jgi:ketosteroid isomerase-like protein
VSANEDLARRALESFNTGGVESALEAFAPDAEWRAIPEWPEDEVYRGHDGLRRLGALWTDNFDDYRIEIERLVDAGDRVVALVHHAGTAKGSGMEISQPLGFVFDVREGRFTRVATYSKWDEALAAAGVDED